MVDRGRVVEVGAVEELTREGSLFREFQDVSADSRDRRKGVVGI